MAAMNPSVTRGLALLCAIALCHHAAQAADSAPNEKSEDAQLTTLIKKIDEQNMKIDALSQQILKLEQQISSIRPGVMIGETTPPPTAPPAVAAPAAASSAATPTSGNAHVVAKGETLISIAKAHKLSVDDLQKFNHIEDPRKLQAGQTIMIPGPGASPAGSPSASPTP